MLTLLLSYLPSTVATSVSLLDVGCSGCYAAERLRRQCKHLTVCDREIHRLT